MQPGVSVVIPVHGSRVHNGLLGRAVRSVFGQTRPPESIIIENDTGRAGAAATRTAGLMKVVTRWTAFLDSDDVLLPQHIATLMEGARAHQADYVYAWYECKRYDGQKPVGTWQDPLPHFGKPFDPARPTQTTITILVRTELAQSIGFTPMPSAMFRKPGRHVAGEDYWFTLRAVEAGAKIVHVPARTWHYVLHPGNTSGMTTKGDAHG